MRYVLLFSFTSCIPLDAVVSPSDSEPVLEPSSELSDQQLTLDIDTEPKIGFGTEFMTGWHLVFEGGLTLKRPMVLGSQNNPVEEEFSDFLRPDRSWGFGATLAPSNEDVQKYFFGDVFSVGEEENHTDGSELALFESRNQAITLQFESLNSPNCGEDRHGVVPILTYRSWFEDGTICEERTFTRTDTSSYVFCASNSIDDYSLSQGFQVVVWYRPHLAESLQLWLNNIKLIYDEAVFSADCFDPQTEFDFDIVFGIGRNYIHPDEVYTGPNYYGRMDNLVLFKTELDDFLEDPTQFFWPVEIDPPGGSEVYAEASFTRDNNFDDGFGWWSFEQPSSELGPPESNVAVDFSPLRPLGTNNLFEMWANNDGELYKLGVEDAQYHYRNSNNDSLEDANWSAN